MGVFTLMVLVLFLLLCFFVLFLLLFFLEGELVLKS